MNQTPVNFSVLASKLVQTQFLNVYNPEIFTKHRPTRGWNTLSSSSYLVSHSSLELSSKVESSNNSIGNHDTYISSFDFPLKSIAFFYKKIFF